VKTQSVGWISAIASESLQRPCHGAWPKRAECAERAALLTKSQTEAVLRHFQGRGDHADAG